MRSSVLVIAFSGLAFGFAGCETLEALGLSSKKDEKSGGDNVRGKAKPLPLNATVDDHVSADDGDHTDWKSFAIAGTTKAVLDVWWDDPAVEATVYVRDQFGGKIFELEHKRGKRHDHFPGIKFREGEYFLEIACESGASVYTLELIVAGGSDAPGSDSIAPPE